jgi:hypothetical protein
MIYRDIITRGDIRRERAERKDQLAREEGRREEELRLLRLQVEREGLSRQLSPPAQPPTKRAELVGKTTGYSGHGGGVTFPTQIRNVGDGVAREVTVWLALAAVDDCPPEGLGRVTASVELPYLAPGDSARFSLEQSGASAGGGVPRDGVIVASWADDSGDHVEAIGKLTLFL